MKKDQTLAKGMNSKQLQDQIAFAQMRLSERLANLELESLKLSEYNQRYLGSKIAGLKGVLHLYGDLLYLCLNNSRVSPQDFVLVDYGGGSGVMSFLAAEMGIGTVIYTDIYDVSCKDVGILSTALGLTVDHIVCGDVDDLVSYLQRNRISIDAITSNDVLEHIYDVESHFKKLGRFTNRKFRIVYASNANIENPQRVRSVQKMQIDAEYKTREKKWGHKERDTLQAFLDVRKNMIFAYAPDLSPETVEHLARATRGLMQRDIEKCVDEFRLHGRITYHIDHPTNTCDPYTGNWCEHLMDLQWLKRIVRIAGFSVEIMAGRYAVYGPLSKGSVKKFLKNVILRILGPRGIFLATYYVLYAELAEQGAAYDPSRLGSYAA
jgi:2-polyprenyl-3-methyl-5-hydroxy-6-metoxy-1,4-benzoquinol methylase